MQEKLAEYPGFNAEDLQIIDRTVLHKGYCSMTRYHLRHRLFKGGWSEVITRELLEQGESVGVLLYDPHLSKVILIEQVRIGARLGETSPWLLEVVAGGAKPDEKVVDVAHREALEETGMTVLALLPICRYWVSPGVSSEHFTLFCGKVDASNGGGIHGLAHEHEDIRVHVVSPEEAFHAVSTGIINNSPAIISLQWLQINLQQVRETWLS